MFQTRSAWAWINLLLGESLIRILLWQGSEWGRYVRAMWKIDNEFTGSQPGWTQTKTLLLFLWGNVCGFLESFPLSPWPEPLLPKNYLKFWSKKNRLRCTNTKWSTHFIFLFFIYTRKIMFITIGLGNMSINNFNEKFFFQKVTSCLERIKINIGWVMKTIWRQAFNFLGREFPWCCVGSSWATRLLLFLR